MPTKKKSLVVDESKALSLYPTASKELKQILEDTFGKDFFVPKKIIDRIKTFEDACKERGENAKTLITRWTKAGLTVSEIAGKKIKIIIEVLNEGKKLDWTNTGQYKYIPYFRRSGARWSYDGYDTWAAACCCAPGFYLETAEKAIYMGRQFADLYNKYFSEQ